MNNVKVSVVVPVYNTSKYLRECLDSIIGQTLKDIEIICVNDGSTDNSLDILREYEREDNRIKIISKENSGYGHTMNVGFSVASGEYIGIVESDDYIQMDMMEKLYDVAKSKDVDFVKSDYYLFWGDDDNRIIEKISLVDMEKLYERKLGKIDIKDLSRGCIANWTGIYKRSFINNHMIRHNETPGASYQDLGFFFQIIMFATCGYLLRENFYMYRQDNENSSINNKKKIYCNCDEYSFIKSILKSNQDLEEYNEVFQFFRFVGYKYNFLKIADEFRIEFLKIIGQEWDEDNKHGELILSYFMPWEKEEFYLMYENPEKYYEENTLFAKKLNDVVKSYKEIIIYGAGVKGTEVYNALKYSLNKFDYICFAVTEAKESMQTKQGLYVKSIYELVNEHKKAAVIIAVTEMYEEELLKVANELGFANIVTLKGLI